MKKRTKIILGAYLSIGILAGVTGYTFYYANGFSYMTDRPETCANCHVMQGYYDSWVKSSHHGVAKCVDCHLPKKLFPKLLAKAENGYRHSKAFTLQNFHEPINITPKSAGILERNCLRCHASLVSAIYRSSGKHDETLGCVRCHEDVGHMI